MDFKEDFMYKHTPPPVRPTLSRLKILKPAKFGQLSSLNHVSDIKTISELYSFILASNRWILLLSEVGLVYKQFKNVLLFLLNINFEVGQAWSCCEC